MDAVLAGLRQKPLLSSKKPYTEALAAFLAEKATTVSPGQLENYRLVGTRFGESLPTKTTLDAVMSDQVTAWLTSLGPIKKKTWNAYRNDLSAFFAWCLARPRRWLEENPVEPVVRYKKKHTVTTPERMAVDTCRSLMAFLEKEQPQWVCFFAVASLPSCAAAPADIGHCAVKSSRSPRQTSPAPGAPPHGTSYPESESSPGMQRRSPRE